jgi:hypothetical protein
MDNNHMKTCRKFLFGLYLPFTIVNLQIAQGVIHVYALLSHAGDRRTAIGTYIPRQFHKLAAMVAGFFQLGMAVRA